DDEGEIAIELVERGEWMVVHDVREKLPVEWAERLAHSLGVGVIGISARSWIDAGEVTIARVDGDRPSGGLSFQGGQAKRRIQTACLADLAPPRNRAKLRAGVSVQGRCDEMLERIISLAGLPEPFDRYMYDTGGTMLRFRRPLRPEKRAGPTLAVRNVR